MIVRLVKRLLTIKNNEVALNTAWQFFERFFGLGCSFISSIFVIRYFAPAEYGIFAYAASYVTLFSALTTMGLQSIAVREMVKKDIPTEEIMGSAFIIMLIGASIAAILAVSGAIFTHEKSLATWVILILCLSNIVNAFSVITYYFQAEIKSRYIAYVMLVQDGADIGIKLALVHSKANLISFALIGLGESIFANLVIYLIFRNYSKLKSWKFRSNTIKFLFHQSLPLAISGVMINIYMRLDQVMIEHYCGMKAVAEYSVGVKLVEIFYMIPMIVTPNVLPIAVAYYKKSEKALDDFLIKLLRYYLLISSIIILATWLFASFLITKIYGTNYSQSIEVFKYSSILVFLSCVGVTGSLWLNVKGLQKYSLLRTASGLITCIICNMIFIPQFGIMGAVYATLLAQFVATYLSSLIFPQIRKYNQLINFSVANFKL